MTINFLQETRFKKSANDILRMPLAEFESYDDLNSEAFKSRLNKYIEAFTNEQLPRLEELKRYYLADNNIKYRPSKREKKRADNRIASDWAKYITVFMQGYILGNPIQYMSNNDALIEKIDQFSQSVNEDYHNGLLETDLSIYGRAYELVYTDKNAQERLTKLAPEQTFVVYDDTIENNSLFGVRLYTLELGTEVTASVEVYTANRIYYFKSGNKAFTDLQLTKVVEHKFNGVPINEYQNNEERLGDFESVLDGIDAYDLSQSELANFQQDSSDAYLVIKGNPVTGTAEPAYDADGNPVPNAEADVIQQMLESRILILDNNNDPDGPDPDAFYLTKTYDSAGVEAYKKRLVDDILRFTFTPDTSDQNFGGVQSGESMKYKLMGNDNLTKTKERLLTRGFMRRLRLLGNVWSIKNSVSTSGKQEGLYDQINNINIKFTPNLPQNNNELINVLKTLYGVISDETLYTLLETYTNVDAGTEMERLRAQQEANAEQTVEQADDYDGLAVDADADE